MNYLQIRFYRADDAQHWNKFVSRARNTTFLFHRNFMDYHKERFTDASVLVFKHQRLVAVLPANINGETLHSHQGLTYGALLTAEDIRSTLIFKIFREILNFLYENGIKYLEFKEIPYFYYSAPCDEWKYLAYICEANLFRRDLCMVINLKSRFSISSTTRRKAKKCIQQGIICRETADWHLFWQEVLIPVLAENHGVAPVHTLEEILSLQRQFPDNIKLFGVYDGENLVGGTVLFINGKTVHCQYIAISNEHRQSGSLHYLFYMLITKYFADYDYFDFGIVQEQQGKKTNSGLLFWKESFGATGVAQDFYKFCTSQYPLIDSMLR